MYKKVLITILALLFVPCFLFAAGEGKISGRVTDNATGEAIIGASVQIEGTVMGASTNINGQYVILNIPPGSYSIRVSQVGYGTKILRGVRVNADQTTELDIKLVDEAVQVNAVEVVAERPMVSKSTTSAVTSITSEDLQNLPVRNLSDIITLSNGVVNSNAANAGGIIIRGGRADEVGYYVDGVNTTNRMGGGEATYFVTTAIEEVQVMAGGYPAEYGGANAGIIKTQLKTGTSDYRVGVELRTDSWAKAGTEVLNTYAYGRSDYSAQVSGPIIPGNNKYRFFIAGQYLSSNNTPNWSPEIDIKGMVDTRQNETLSTPGNPVFDTIDFYWPARLNARNNFSWQTRWNGNVLMDFQPFQIRVSGTHRYGEADNGYARPGVLTNGLVSQQQYYEQTGSLRLTHFVSPTTFYNVSFNVYNRLSQTHDREMGYDWAAFADSIILKDKYGLTMRNPGGYWTDPMAHEVFGNPAFTFYRPDTRGYVVSGSAPFSKVRWQYIGGNFDFTHQVGLTHEIKVGGDFQRYTYRTYSFSNSNFANLRTSPDRTIESLVSLLRPSTYGYDYFGNEIDGVDGARHPVFAAAYLQDKIEFSDIVLNLGLRYDYISTDGFKLKDPRNVVFNDDNMIVDDQLVTMEASHTISPRIGLSFALTDQTIFYAAWGKFVQQSKLGDTYAGRPWMSQVVNGSYAYPNTSGYGIKPERTTQYDVGFKQQIGDNLAFDISAYYKDIKDQVTSGFQTVSSEANHSSYYTLVNSDFATTKGIEFKLTLRRTERIAAQFNYTYSDARGTGSQTDYSPRYYIIWQAPTYNGEFMMPTFIMPLLFNYPHSGNAWIDYRFGDKDGGPILQNLGINLLFTFNSGRSYTRIDPASSDFGSSQTQHHGNPIEPYGYSQTPWVYLFDLTIDKDVNFGKLRTNFYITIYNLLNSKLMTNVFPETGTADDDGYFATPAGILAAKENGPDFVKLYNWVYIERAGNYTSPRQVYLGVKINF
jgi:outer membrane receptor protein involved in Fe transport